MSKTSQASTTTDTIADNVIWLEVVRHRFPYRNRRPHRSEPAGDIHGYPSLYIFPAWRTPRDSVGG